VAELCVRLHPERSYFALAKQIVFMFYSLLWNEDLIGACSLGRNGKKYDKTLDSTIIWEKTLKTSTPSFLRFVAVSQSSLNLFPHLDH